MTSQRRNSSAASGIAAETLQRYQALVATVVGLEHKGATMPYTAVNGNMFSFLDKEGRLSLRLPQDEREAFLEKYGTSLSEQYGAVMKEYVVVPSQLLESINELEPYFMISYAYASSLKPKQPRGKN